MTLRAEVSTGSFESIQGLAGPPPEPWSRAKGPAPS